VVDRFAKLLRDLGGGACRRPVGGPGARAIGALAVLVAVALASVVPAGAQPATPNPADEAAVRALPAQVTAAFPDGEAVAAAFTEDADFIVAEGTHLKGRVEIVAYFQRLLEEQDEFGTSLQGVKSTAEVRDLRFLTDDVALMHTTGGLLFPGETAVPPDRRTIQTWVATKAGGTWLVASYQSSPIEPQP
jgi:uncharacterized protein (TIGR02246 family)